MISIRNVRLLCNYIYETPCSSRVYCPLQRAGRQPNYLFSRIFRYFLGFPWRSPLADPARSELCRGGAGGKISNCNTAPGDKTRC